MICVYGLNALGRDEVRGYGAVHMPIAPGRWACGWVGQGFGSKMKSFSIYTPLLMH